MFLVGFEDILEFDFAFLLYFILYHRVLICDGLYLFDFILNLAFYLLWIVLLRFYWRIAVIKNCFSLIFDKGLLWLLVALYGLLWL